MGTRLLYRRLSIFFIAFSLSGPMLYSLHFYISRMAHRLEMWEYAENGQLHSVEIDSASIQWTKKNRELILGGAYFDVVSISYQNSKATIRGVFDQEETEMHEAFANAQQSKSSKNHTTQKLADWLQTVWFENNDFLIVQDISPTPIIRNGTIPALHPIGMHEPPIPPPWALNNL